MYQLTKTVILGLAATALISAPAVAQPGFSQNPAELHAGAYALDASHGKITWSVNHFGLSTYVGQFTAVSATLKIDPKAPQGAELQATVDTGSVATLNTALDNHLKGADFLDVAKYPQATFKATSVKVTGERTADITGDLTLHGVTKPVVIKATFNSAGVFPDKKYTAGFAGTAQIKRSEFGIKAFVPFVGDDVTLQFEAEFKAAS